MSDHDAELGAIEDAARALLPELSRRLRDLGLGEIEVRRGWLRLKVTARRDRANRVTAAAPAAATAEPGTPGGDAATASDATPARDAIVSPAVGIFVYADGLGPGIDVAGGQAVGHVDMLGVPHDVRAPHAGRVVSLVAESGEPVEYGQLLVEVEPSEVGRR
ncbi:MAG: hypothetical protein M3295_02475 [Chloroflexota bacterium]|nr:hypothetical protein [Chloroflexota bacterium]